MIAVDSSPAVFTARLLEVFSTILPPEAALTPMQEGALRVAAEQVAKEEKDASCKRCLLELLKLPPTATPEEIHRAMLAQMGSAIAYRMTRRG